MLVVAVAALVLAAMVFTANFVGAASACSGHTSYCAASTEKNGVYRAALFGFDGKPYRNARIRVLFNSRIDIHGDIDVTYRTDAKGHVCIVWARESLRPYAMTWFFSPVQVRHTGGKGFGEWRSLHEVGLPAGCQQSSATIPWHRASDLRSSWQYWLILLASLSSMLALSLALLLRRRQLSRYLTAVGVLMLFVGLIAGVILWSL